MATIEIALRMETDSYNSDPTGRVKLSEVGEDLIEIEIDDYDRKIRVSRADLIRAAKLFEMGANGD